MRPLFYFLLFVLASCGNEADTGNAPQPDTTQKEAPAPTNAQCYLKVTGRDSLRIALREQGNQVSGEVAFNNYQKDSSHGPVEGSLEGDQYVLWYSFQSEGMHSVMQLVFKKTKKGLIRGVGQMETRGDTTLFTTPIQLRFDDTELIPHISCDSLGAVIR